MTTGVSWMSTAHEQPSRAAPSNATGQLGQHTSRAPAATPTMAARNAVCRPVRRTAAPPTRPTITSPTANSDGSRATWLRLIPSSSWIAARMDPMPFSR